MADVPYISPPLEPYSSLELQSKFSGVSPRDAYIILCKRFKCKSISAIASMLSERVGGWADTTDLDLSRTYAGPRGVLPIIELCKLLPELRSISMKDNYIDNAAVWALCKMAVHHPSLRAIDVSNNSVSWVAGMSLLELASHNNNIQTIHLHNTSLKPRVLEMIRTQVQRNIALRNRHARGGPNPSNHPLSIRIRALHRYFLDIATRESPNGDLVPRAALADGLRESLKLCGRDSDNKQRSPQFYQALISRAPKEMVNWDEFLLLIMGEHISINALLIDRLRYVFNTFDIDGSGYVEAQDLGAIMTCLSAAQEPPSAEELAAKRAMYDLDDTMSLQWDEFLLMLYDLGPIHGAISCNTSTPLILQNPVINS